MSRILVTGRQGFVGRAFTAILQRDPWRERWQAVPLDESFDLRDPAWVERVVRQGKPDAVLHLAAQSFVPESFRDPRTTMEVNLLGTLNLLLALKSVGFGGRLVYVGTGDVYGIVPEAGLPISEATIPRPRSPYAVSKLAAEALCWQWHASEGLDVIIARPFNHIGWGQSDRFAISAFARQIAEVHAHRRPPVLAVGNIDVTRDFTDVNDVALAYLALLEHGAVGETYNVCSGIEYRLRSLLERMTEIAGVAVRVELDQERVRPTEQRRVCGDPSKIRLATGWTPRVPIDDSLRAVLNYWEGAIQHG